MPPRKPKLSSDLGDLVEASPSTSPARSQLDNGLTVSSENVVSASSEAVTSAKRPPSRVSKHHISLYIGKRVDVAIKRIALDQGKRTHECYADALRAYLREHGQDFDVLNRD